MSAINYVKIKAIFVRESDSGKAILVRRIDSVAEDWIACHHMCGGEMKWYSDDRHWRDLTPGTEVEFYVPDYVARDKGLVDSTGEILAERTASHPPRRICDEPGCTAVATHRPLHFAGHRHTCQRHVPRMSE